ncbi:hypothetical protein ACFQX7_18845 [Luedemannella flava]
MSNASNAGVYFTSGPSSKVSATSLLPVRSSDPPGPGPLGGGTGFTGGAVDGSGAGVGAGVVRGARGTAMGAGCAAPGEDAFAPTNA